MISDELITNDLEYNIFQVGDEYLITKSSLSGRLEGLV